MTKQMWLDLALQSAVSKTVPRKQCKYLSPVALPQKETFVSYVFLFSMT